MGHRPKQVRFAQEDGAEGEASPTKAAAAADAESPEEEAADALAAEGDALAAEGDAEAAAEASYHMSYIW